MIRRFAGLLALAVAACVLATTSLPAATQEAGTEDCASALWLDPRSPNPTADTAPALDLAVAPAWMSIDLVDACTGDEFTIADFAGKTIYIEGMATWCPPCRDQLVRLTDAFNQIPELEREEIVIVALSSEVDLPPEALADYAAANGFPFVFAVMPIDMLQAMADDLGQEIAVPPATPHLIVAPDGTIGDIQTGSSSPEELLTLFAETRDASAP
ncbi:MAG: TlpA family protein disulfide reductase [Chloroflexota bacterium]|nr:TlpA family protein disulfide reductase [Chloroflexota bacterium]